MFPGVEMMYSVYCIEYTVYVVFNIYVEHLYVQKMAPINSKKTLR